MAKGGSNPGGALVTGLLVAVLAWFLWTRYLRTSSRIVGVGNDVGTDVGQVVRDIGAEFDEAIAELDGVFGRWSTRGPQVDERGNPIMYAFDPLKGQTVFKSDLTFSPKKLEVK